MRILGSLLICCLAVAVLAQQPSRSDLEKQRQQILESIKETQAQLAATKNDQKASISQLRALQAKLYARQKLIQNYNQEIANIDSHIGNSTTEISQLERTLQMQRARYAQSVRYAYKHRNSYDMLTFLFSADDFNEAIRRMRYLKRYRDLRKEQVVQIRVTQNHIKEKMGILETQRSQKEGLVKVEEGEKTKLVDETSEANNVVTQLKGREKELAEQIEKSRRSARQLDAQINKIIQREIELAQKKAAEEERKRQEEEARKAEAAAKAANNYGGVTLNRGSSNNPNQTIAPGSKAVITSAPSASNNKTNPPPATVYTPKPVSAPPSYKLTLTPEATALSNSFEANRGRLPWPVEKGFISLRFGPYRDPLNTHIELYNNGVSISTGQNATARAVFDGNVSSSFYINGAGWTIVVNHGLFYTVYSGLASTSVQKGQQVRLKQTIGVVGENDEGVPTINFQVWKVSSNNKSSKVDPEQWIAK